MQRSILSNALKAGVRNFSSAHGPRVAVIGAAGGIGQPLSLLMKANPLVAHLHLYDLAPHTPGVGADVSHINTGAKVKAFVGGDDQLEASLKDCDVVIIPAGVPRKEGMTRDDLFNVNAKIVANIARAASKSCPNAALLIISNPVNSTVPIASEIQKRLGTYNAKKIFGVTTLDVCRANAFVAENQGFDVSKVNVPVIGGHAGKTILPLLSQVKGAKFSQKDVEALTQRIMFGGDEVVKAKAGAGSATLSMAYAGAHFATQVLRAANGGKGIIECSYVKSDIVPGVEYFSTPIELGPSGVAKIHGYGTLNAFEQKCFDEMLAELKGSIAKGKQFAADFKL